MFVQGQFVFSVFLCLWQLFGFFFLGHHFFTHEQHPFKHEAPIRRYVQKKTGTAHVNPNAISAESLLGWCVYIVSSGWLLQVIVEHVTGKRGCSGIVDSFVLASLHHVGRRRVRMKDSSLFIANRLVTHVRVVPVHTGTF